MILVFFDFEFFSFSLSLSLSSFRSIHFLFGWARPTGLDADAWTAGQSITFLFLA